MLVELSNVQPQIQSGVLLLVASYQAQLFVCVGDAKTSRGLPGTDQNGEYLVRQLVDYAYSMLNTSSSYVIPIVEQTAEVVILSCVIMYLCIVFY